jgi:hypothetical protein
VLPDNPAQVQYRLVLDLLEQFHQCRKSGNVSVGFVQPEAAFLAVFVYC